MNFISLFAGLVVGASLAALLEAPVKGILGDSGPRLSGLGPVMGRLPERRADRLIGGPIFSVNTPRRQK